MVQWSPTALKGTLVPGPGLSSAVPSFSKTMVLNVVSSPCTWLWLGLPWETQGKVGGIWVMECVILYFMYIESFSVSCFLCSTVSYKFAESIICAPESIMDSRVPMDSWQTPRIGHMPLPTKEYWTEVNQVFLQNSGINKHTLWIFRTPCQLDLFTFWPLRALSPNKILCHPMLHLRQWKDWLQTQSTATWWVAPWSMRTHWWSFFEIRVHLPLQWSPGMLEFISGLWYVWGRRWE